MLFKSSEFDKSPKVKTSFSICFSLHSAFMMCKQAFMASAKKNVILFLLVAVNCRFYVEKRRIWLLMGCQFLIWSKFCLRTFLVPHKRLKLFSSGVIKIDSKLAHCHVQYFNGNARKLSFSETATPHFTCVWLTRCGVGVANSQSLSVCI